MPLTCNAITPQQMTKVLLTIVNAANVLGPLTKGQTSDLLCDNLSWITDSNHAHAILANLEAQGMRFSTVNNL